MINDQMLEEIKSLVSEIIGKLDFSSDMTATIVDEGENQVIQIDMNDESLSPLIGYRGKNLESLEYVVNRAFNLKREEPVRIFIDVNGYKVKRDEYLKNLAQRAYDDAKESGQPVFLSAMRPPERRVIHVYLQNFDDVETTSEGDEPERYIVVKPKNK